MLSYCLLCRKNTKSKNAEVAKKNMEAKCFYHTVWFLVVKNQTLLKSKNLAEF